MLRKFNKMFKKSVKIYIDVFFVQWYNRCVYFNMEDNLGVYIMQKRNVKNIHGVFCGCIYSCLSAAEWRLM